MKEMVIGRNDSGQRLDKYLTKALPALPEPLLYKYIRLKRIKVNGKRADAGYKLQEYDVLQLYINDELLERPDEDSAWRLVKPQFDVVYEDMNIILADKPAGMLCHEDESGDANTLINGIKARLYNNNEWNPELESSFAPALCNRIDRNTGGIVIAAKTAAALRDMNARIKSREVDKYYLCLVHGTYKNTGGTLEGFITRDMDAKQVSVSRTRTDGSVGAKTEYTVLDTRDGISLVECRLLTGRTHQIRAQFADAGHPLVGDTKYGTAAINRGLPFAHQALYSYKVRFSFADSHGELGYLRNTSYRVKSVPFMDFFENLQKNRK